VQQVLQGAGHRGLARAAQPCKDVCGGRGGHR
jgi:hypothetical protein